MDKERLWIHPKFALALMIVGIILVVSGGILGWVFKEVLWAIILMFFVIFIALYLHFYEVRL